MSGWVVKWVFGGLAAMSVGFRLRLVAGEELKR